MPAPYGAPYSDDMFSDIFANLFTTDRTTQGVIPSTLSGFSGLLDATYDNSKATIATGIGICDGKVYTNSASVDLTFPGNNTYYAVLRKSWASQTVRLALVTSLTQTDGTTWDIPLHSFVRAGGVVTTYADLRRFVQQGPRLTHRQGNHANQWHVNGSTDYSVAIGQYRIQVGATSFTGGNTSNYAYTTVTYPQAYPTSCTPVVFIQERGDKAMWTDAPGTTGFDLYWWDDDTTTYFAMWMAIGPMYNTSA